MYALKKSTSSAPDSDSQRIIAPVDTLTSYGEPSTSWAHNNVQTSSSWATHYVSPHASWTNDDNVRPSTSYAHFEPSSRAHFSTVAPSTSTAADKSQVSDNDTKSSSSDDNDYLSSDESDSDENLRDIMASYMYKRNIKISDVIDANNSSQPLIEYVNLKYIENNFRTIGLNTAFDKNNIEGAQLEFESFEKWFIQSKKKYVGPQCINDLCTPIFCHLYLSLYTPQNHKRLIQLLDKFKHLFLSKRGFKFFQELKKVTDMNQLPYCITIFRRNKYTFFVSPEFLSELNDFFQQHVMLQLIFQEWFDINYITDEDQNSIVEEYLNRDLPYRYHISTNKSQESKGNNLKNTFTQDDLSINTTQDKKKHQIDDQPSLQNGRKHGNLLKKLRGEEFNDSSSQNESSHKEINKKTKVDQQGHTVKERKNIQDPSCNNATKNSGKQRNCQVNYKLSGRSKSLGDNRSSNDGSSESSEDSSSGTSFFDEESAMRKYFRYQRKSGKRLSFKTLNFFKYGNTSKIELKSIDGDLYLHNTKQIMLKGVSKITCTLITIDHKYVAAGSVDSIIYLWERTNVPTEKEINNLLNNMNCSLRKSVNFDDREKNTEFLDKNTAVVLRGHGGCIFDLAELPSAKILLSASGDKTFRAWHLETKVCLEVYDEYEHRTWCIAACPYSLQVATGSCEGSSCLWFLNYKRPLRIFMGHFDDILVIKFHPNLVILATGSADKTIRIFELVTGNCQRLLLGHTNYVTCLEFHPQDPKILASAAGGGEIMVWDLPTGYAIWKLRVGNVVFSELSWLTNDILLASLITGVVLKCDVRVDYLKTRKKVQGFQTRFKRLISLSIIDTIVYTIGIQGKSSILKPNVTKLQKKASAEYEQQQERTTLNRNREPSPLSKLFLPELIVENNSNSIRTLLGSNTTTVNIPKVDLQYQLNMGPNDKTQESSEFLKMNLQRSPFNLTIDDINKINSQNQSPHISLIEKHYSQPSTEQILRNALLLPIQSDSSLPKFAPADKNYFEEYEEKYNFTHVKTSQHSIANLHNDNNSLQSHLSNITQHQFSEQELAANLMDVHNAALQSLREQKIRSADRETQAQLLLYIANNIHVASANAQEKIKLMHEDHHKLLHCQLQKKKQKELERQQYQNQQQQKLQYQFQQQQPQVFRKLQPHRSVLSKMNFQQKQKHIQLTNMSVSKPSDEFMDGNSVRLSSRQQRRTTTAGQSSEIIGTSQNYERMRQVVMESLSQTNPEMFVGGSQPIIEVTISQSTNLLPNNTTVKSEQKSD